MTIKKKWITGVLLVCVIMALAACGGSKWEGTYGGTSTSDNKIEITIDKNGTAIYNENGEEIEGEWTENDHSIELDFDGEYSDKYEPLIVTLSSDEGSITVESMGGNWNPDTYQRR